MKVIRNVQLIIFSVIRVYTAFQEIISVHRQKTDSLYALDPFGLIWNGSDKVGKLIIVSMWFIQFLLIGITIIEQFNIKKTNDNEKVYKIQFILMLLAMFALSFEILFKYIIS